VVGSQLAEARLFLSKRKKNHASLQLWINQKKQAKGIHTGTHLDVPIGNDMRNCEGCICAITQIHKFGARITILAIN
jgi:hypothetical protein